jgi:hypothetical protein
MGRQINFFLGAADQAPFEASLRSLGDFAVLGSRSPSPMPLRLCSTVVETFGEELLRVYLARPQDVDQLHYRLIGNGTEYTPDVLRDPVIEFDRCFVSDGFIRRGRLYYVSGYFDEANRKIRKSEAFIEWADRVMRKAARELGTKVDGICYAGLDALKQQAAGVQLRHD